MDCIFCKIINGDLPSAKVYEDDYQIAFLDLNPVMPGHTLLVPKKHHINIFDADQETAKHVYPALSILSNAIRTVTGCSGINIVQNNGKSALQEVFHSHVHIIPRFDDDNIRIAVAGKKQADFGELAQMAGNIKAEIK